MPADVKIINRRACRQAAALLDRHGKVFFAALLDPPEVETLPAMPI